MTGKMGAGACSTYREQSVFIALIRPHLVRGRDHCNWNGGNFLVSCMAKFSANKYSRIFIGMVEPAGYGDARVDGSARNYVQDKLEFSIYCLSDSSLSCLPKESGYSYPCMQDAYKVQTVE